MDFLDAYIGRRLAELEELDSELKTVEFRVSDAPLDRQVQLYEDLQALRAHYDKTRQKLGEMREATGHRREELKDLLEAEWKELQDGMQRAQQSLH